MVASLKILHTCETTGGVGIYLRALSQMSPQDVSQIFHMPTEHTADLEGDPRLERYPRTKRGIVTLANQIRSLRRLIGREKPDVVVFHSTFSLLALVLTRLRRSRAKRPRLIYIAHGWAGDQYSGVRQRLVRTIEGCLCGFADLVINISQHDLETARRYDYRGHHVVIENAVPDAMAGARDDCFAAEPETLHLLFVGRFDRQKGLDILLKALTSAQESRPDLKLHVIGGAMRAGSAPVFPLEVDHLGWVPYEELDQWYRSADAIVVPSRWEGFGLVVAEALRNGTPALVSDRGALPDLIEEGATGHVFTLEGDDLRNSLLKLDKSNLLAMRSACRGLYERRYSMPRLHAEILRAYRSVTGVEAE